MSDNDQYNAVMIAELVTKLLKFLESDPTDPMVKVAALRASAETLTQAITSHALLLSLHKTLNK